MDKKITLSDNLTKLMDERGVTVSVTAKKIGMNKTTLHNYCNGTLPRNLVSIVKLSDFLGVTLSELVFGHEQDRKNISATIEGRYEVVIKQIQDLSRGKGNL